MSMRCLEESAKLINNWQQSVMLWTEIVMEMLKGGRPKTCRVSKYLFSGPWFWGASFGTETGKRRINGQMPCNQANRSYGI